MVGTPLSSSLPLCRPFSRARVDRQHPLHDPRWRGCPLQHALPQACSRLYAHGARVDRQHPLHDPLWRGCPLQHVLPEACSRLHTHRVPPSTLPASDPVRAETAACLRKCMLEGTTPPAWAMQLVLPVNTRPGGGPTERQIGDCFFNTRVYSTLQLKGVDAII